jgi:glycosyltransferase 2 family protein
VIDVDTSESAAVEPGPDAIPGRPRPRARRAGRGGGAATATRPGLRERLARILPVVRTVGFVAAVAIVIWMAVKAVQEVDFSTLTWSLLIPALLATGVWWVLLARGWALLMSGHATRADVSLWCRTQTLRYLPGGIWAPASRVAAVKGTAQDRLGTVAAENVIALCAALAVGGVALTLSGEPWWLPLALMVIVPVLAARLTAGRTRVAPARARAGTWNYVAAFAAYAVAAVLVQGAVSGFHDALGVAGAATLAWGAGLVVIIAPSGVGVREVVYVALLSHAFGRPELTAGAVTLRVVTIVAELAVLVVAGRPAAGPPVDPKVDPAVG